MALTRLAFVTYVTIGALAVIFCSPTLRPLRDIGAVFCLAWLANYAFDLWENAGWPRAIINFLYRKRSLNVRPNSQSSWDLQRAVSVITPWLSESKELIRHYVSEICRYVRIAVLKAPLIVGGGSVSRSAGSEAERTYGANPFYHKYYALLVTTPPVHVYGPSSDYLSNSHVIPEPLPWDSYSTNFIPPLLPSVVFQTHVAFCLVRKSDWESRSLTLFEKLQNQHFWDLEGQDSGCVGALWSKDQIAKIDRIENLGVIGGGKDVVDVCTQCYFLLHHGWKYYNIWWNDVDFALLLAYLVVGARTGTKCAAIMKKFDLMRYKEVIEPREVACGKAFTAGWFLGSTGIGLVAAAAGLGLVLPFIGATTSFDSAATGVVLGLCEVQSFRRRQEACRNLVQRIPKLNAFF